MVEVTQDSLCRNRTHIAQRLANRRQCRILVRGALNIIETDHGDIFRYSQSGFAKRSNRSYG